MIGGAETGDWRSLEAHPIAGLMPVINAADFGSLVESMEQEGFLPDHPILLYQGKILDGRSRHAAAIKTGRTPVFREFSGDDPLAYVFSANMARRHLTASQKAFAIAGLADYYQKHFKAPEFRKFSHFLAEKANVSARSIERAIQIRKKGTPRLQEAVEAGTIKLGRAELIAQMEPGDQDRVTGVTGEVVVREVRRLVGAKRVAEVESLTLAEVPVTRCDSLIALPPYGESVDASREAIKAHIQLWWERWRGCGATWIVFGWRNGGDMPAVLEVLVGCLRPEYVYEHMIVWDFSHPRNGTHPTGLRASLQPVFVFRAKGAGAKVAPMPKDLRRLTLLPDQDLFQYPLDEAAYGGAKSAEDALRPLRHRAAEVLRYLVTPFAAPGSRVVACWTPQVVLDEAGKDLDADLIGV